MSSRATHHRSRPEHLDPEKASHPFTSPFTTSSAIPQERRMLVAIYIPKERICISAYSRTGWSGSWPGILPERAGAPAALREKGGAFPLTCLQDGGWAAGDDVPTEYGGSDAGAVSYCLALEEIASACASTAVTMSVANLSTEPLLKFGDESQKQRYLVPLASGKALGCFAVTEPGAGSDPGGLMLKAEEKGGCYLLNGTKVFITHGEYADVVNLVARTGPDKGNKGLSAFVVEKGTPGFSVGKREDKMGLRASNTVELVFEDCLVPAENLVGRPGRGFKIA